MVGNSVSFSRLLKQSFKSVIGAQVERLESALRDVTFLHGFWINPSYVKEVIKNKNQLLHQQVGSSYSRSLFRVQGEHAVPCGPNIELNADLLIKEDLSSILFYNDQLRSRGFYLFFQDKHFR